MTDKIDDRDKLQKKALREINLRYIFAVGLIATFSIITFCLNRSLHQTMHEDFKTINLSGRQRMLSQRIALLSGKGDSHELNRSIKEFESGLHFLLHTRFVNPKHPELYKLYHGDDGLDKLSEKFITLVRSGADQTEVFELSQQILYQFDEATLIKQHISEAEFTNRFRLEMLFLALTLILLTIEIFFIFRPMASRVRKTFTQLNRIEDKSLINSRLAMIGEIASSIGHEIKNPLSAILVYSERGMQSNPEDTTGHNHHFFTQIHKSSDRIHKIVKSLAIQSREASQDPMAPTPVKNLIDDAVEMFSSKMKYADIKLTTDLNYEGTINCRHAAISQVIANLLGNAIDAISEQPNTDREIKIESGKSGDEIYLRVIDSGPGVPDDIQGKIFDSFMTTKESGKGTGLGLAIAKKIMRDHHGEILVNTQISNSCFEMRFHS